MNASLTARLLAGMLASALIAGPCQAASGAQAAPAPALVTTASAAPDAAEASRLHALFDASWEALMRRHPEWATYSGDHRYGDKLEDASPAARAAEYDDARRTLAQAQSIRRDRLSTKDQASLDIFIHRLEELLRQEPMVGFRSMSLGALGGFQSQLSELMLISPVGRASEAELVLGRLAAFPLRVDQELALLREGLALGWVPPRTVLERVLPQLDAQLQPQVDQSPFFEPFTRLGADIPAAERAALQARARATITGQVLPALRRLRAFVADEYLPAAVPDGAMGRYPGGAAVYAEQVRLHTTTALTPAEVHAIGQREVARLHGEMLAVMRELKFEGDFAAFVSHLNTDPTFFHPSAEALLAGYRDIAKRIDPELPRLFMDLPRAPYGVRAMPSHSSTDRAEFYSPPALDGSRPGWFNANAQAYLKRPTWGMETLTAHETVPGHHLQIARAVELGELPRFRRGAGFTAYSEGWALYAETLGTELGLYKDPHSRFGHLQAQAFRAARLVVDTGIHALGWSRQQAIDFMVAQTGQNLPFITSEVDRYYSSPGQALAYMVGQLKIMALRDRAKARLGQRFDIRQFHRVVLDQGSVPLPLLERAVDAWIEAGGAAVQPAAQPR